MYYILNDGRVTTDETILGGNDYIASEYMPDYIIKKDNIYYLLTGIENGELKYEECSLQENSKTPDEMSSYDIILNKLDVSQDEIRQEGADLMMVEL
ncbi:unknown [Firmicutes bacterium CAG:466]|nr:unknown [Firmicutes bacterium CAG:466]